MPRTRQNPSDVDQLLDDAVITASASISATDKTGYGAAKEIVLYIRVVAASGTGPTLTVSLQDSPDGVLWATIGTSAQLTGAGQVAAVRFVGAFADRIRLYATVGGTTPSFTIDAFVISQP